MFINTILFILLSLLIQNVWNDTNVSSTPENCVVKHDGQKLTEGDSISIKGKLYKVEGCEMHRAYHLCGTQILQAVNLVCRALEQHHIISNKKRYPRFSKQKLLTEACCQQFCTISEMTRYCP